MAGLIDRIMVIIDATSSGAVKELKDLEGKAKKTGDTFDTIGKKAGLAGGAIKAGLAAGAAAFIGANLVSFLNDSVDAFGDAAKAAGELAVATGGSVENVSRMKAALEEAGVGADKFTGMMTKFTTNAGKNKDLLNELGVQLKLNADGSVDYADGMVQAVDAINDIGDASARNAALVQLFGKQGATAFQELFASGMDLSEAMELVSKYKVFTADDVQRAKNYDDAMDTLKASFQDVQFAVGEALIPAISGIADAVSGFVDFILNIPGPVKDFAVAVGLAAGALVIFNKTLAIMKSEAAGTLFVTMLDGVAKLIGPLVGVEGAAAKAGVAIRGMGNAFKAAMVSAGPFVALIALIEVAMNTLSESDRWEATAFDNVGKTLDQQAQILRETDSIIDSFVHPDWGANTGDVKRITDSWTDMANATLENVDATDIQKVASQELLDVINAGNLGTDEGTAAMEKYAEAMGGAEAMSAVLAEEQKGLKDMIADIVTNGASAETTWSDIAETAQGAAEAFGKVAQSTELNDIAMGLYAATVQSALGWQKKLFGIPVGIEEAKNSIQSSFKELVDIVDKDGKKVGEKWALIGDDAKTAGDETVIAMGKAEIAVADYADALAAGGMPTTQILEELDKLKTEFPELSGVIDGVKASIEGLPNEIPMDITFDVEGTQAKVDDLKARIKTAIQQGDYGLVQELQAELDATDPANFPLRIANAIQQKDYGLADTLLAQYNMFALATGATKIKFEVDETSGAVVVKEDLETDGESTVTINADGTAAEETKAGLTEDVDAQLKLTTTFEPGGYEAVKSRKDHLLEAKETTLKINTAFEPDGYNAIVARLNHIMSYDGQTPDVSVWTHFEPGGYNATVARLDHINSYDGSTPDINIWTHWNPGGYEAIKSRIDFVSKNRDVTINFRTNGLAAAVAAVSTINASAQQQQIRLPQFPVTPQPINIVKVNVDGKQLRATIREELGLVRASDDYLAARGVVA